MKEIVYHDCCSDMREAGADAAVIMDPTANGSCGYAFFPGCRLCAAEPEIAVKIYDSILQQHRDTAIITDHCGSDGLADAWQKLGRPVIVTPCLECLAVMKDRLPQAKIIPLYGFLTEMSVSGGCNSADYIIYDPEKYPADSETRGAVAELAESMGATLHDEGDGDHPYITYCMDCRDSLKRQGKDAVHILELVYGMGDSNAHMEHSHDHDHGHAGEAKADADDAHAGSGDGDDDGCNDTARESAPLPSEQERLDNMRELAKALPLLFG